MQLWILSKPDSMGQTNSFRTNINLRVNTKRKRTSTQRTKYNFSFLNIHGENTWIFRRLLEATTAGGRQKFVTAFQNFLTKKVSSNFELGRQPSRGRSLSFKVTQWYWIEVDRKSKQPPQNIWRPIAILFAAGNNWRLPLRSKLSKQGGASERAGNGRRPLRELSNAANERCVKAIFFKTFHVARRS